MSKINDDIKSDSNAVNVVLNSENSMSNDKNKKVRNVVSNGQNISHSKNNIEESNVVNKDLEKFVFDGHVLKLKKKKKGLSYDEIEEIPFVMNDMNNAPYFEYFYGPYGLHALPDTSDAVQVSEESEKLFKELVWNVTWALSFVFISYNFYKNYLKKWMFFEPEKFLNRLEVIESTVQKIKKEVDLRNLKSENEIKDIMNELKSIKGLLTHNHIILPVPASSTLPKWQLPKKRNN